MFKTIIDKMKRDTDYPQRSFMIDVYTRFLNGTFYDHLQYPFHQEKNNEEYIPVLERRPSVTLRLAKIIVDDSVTLLFGDGHFPQVECKDEALRTTLHDIIDECKLNERMIQAATIGSVGSVAIIMQVLENKLFFKPLSTQYLTPIFDPLNPDRLIKINEKYKVSGADLLYSGYTNLEKDEDYWLIREWDSANELRYLPFPVINDDEKAVPQVDNLRSTKHDLGFVPIVWIRNLPQGDDIDGECTFQAAINTNIEIDYQLSQAGRGLRYSSDPTLLVKEPAVGQNNELIKGAGNGLLVGKDGDAKYLEINGDASRAVIEYAEFLRKIALENIHGNRANPDKLSVAQSGYAMELMYLPLVWLAGRLRITYGNGLLELLKMVIAASQKYKIQLNDKTLAKLDQGAKITLRWPEWFMPTTSDNQTKASTLKTLKDASIISQETAVKNIAQEYAIQDPAAEIAQIEKEQAAFIEANQPNVTEMKQI